MRNPVLFITTLVAFATAGVVALSAQSALDQLKAYNESGPAANKGAATAKEAAPGAQAKAPSTPGGLPDVIGIHLRMPLREAFTILQTAHPKEKLETDAIKIPGIDKPVLAEFRYDNYYTAYKGPGSQIEKVAVDVTPPPNQQVVWKVRRDLSGQKIYRANLLSSLREKYGKEAGTNPQLANDQRLQD